MDLKNKENIEIILSKFKKIKNTVINLKKVNQQCFYIIL